MIGGIDRKTGRKRVGIAIAILIAAIILICAWAPWLPEEYGKEKVLNYFNQSYGVDKSDIRIGSVEKKPFEIDFGLYLSPANKSLPETSVRAWVTFYGEVKHEILSAPWFTEENAREKVLDYFSQKYGVDRRDIKINYVKKKSFEIHFGLSLPPQNNGRLSHGSIVHAWVTVYGEVKHDEIRILV